MEDTSLMTGTDASAEHIWRNTCSPTRFVLQRQIEIFLSDDLSTLALVCDGISPSLTKS